MKKKTELGGLHTAKLYMKLDDGRAAEVPVVSNICHHKNFKPFDEVLVKFHSESGNLIWVPMIYSFFDVETNSHVLINCMTVADSDIIPFDKDKAGKPVETIK